MKPIENRLKAIQEINTTITTSLDLRVSLQILLEKLIEQLEVDAAAIFLLDRATMEMNFMVGKGIQATPKELIALSRDMTSKMLHEALEKAKRQTSNIEDALKSEPSALMKQEGFVAQYLQPLVSKGQFLGVIEIFLRTPLPDDPQWVEFLHLLGQQAAITIDSSAAFENLQRTNFDLSKAYDSTLEGWMRALELRSIEAVGQAKRVSILALQFGKAVGFQERDLIHLHRGAMLHNIGTLGIPDAILFKPAPFTDMEMQIMRREPVMAYEMLSKIEYLRPAADIPYCCHENWDGSGYPRGLKGEEIPLSARLVAIVMTWDDLCSAHPYRPPVEQEQAREDIRTMSGTRFDPKLVEAFLNLLDG